MEEELTVVWMLSHLFGISEDRIRKEIKEIANEASRDEKAKTARFRLLD